MRVLKKRIFSLFIICFFTTSTLFYTFPINANSPDNLELKWSVVTGMDAYIGPVTKDIDGDGIHEIFLAGRREGTTTGRIICVDGATGSINWEVNFTSGTADFHVPCAIADLDNDGTYEIVHTADSRTIARNCEDGSEFWRVSVPSGWHQLVIADVDGNNLPYVYVSDHGGDTQYIRKLCGIDGSIAAESPHFYSCYGGVSAADLQGDGSVEFFVSDRSGGSGGKGVRCFDSDLNELWFDSAVWCSSHCIMPVDIDGDNVLEVVVGHQSSGLYVYNSQGNRITGKYSNGLGLNVHCYPAVYDIDKDGHIEFATAYGSSLKIWDITDWSLDFVSSYTHIDNPPNFANVIGDDDLEMIVCDAWNGQIHIYNSNYVEEVTLNRNAYSTTTQDIDDDGKNEMIVLFNNNLCAYDTYADAPEQPVRTDTPYYSERRTGAAVYIPPIGSSQSNSPPYIPSSPSPIDGELDVGIDEMLSWVGGDPNPGDTVTYDVYFGTDSTPDSGELVSDDQTGTFFYLDSIEYETTFYWKIIASDNHGDYTEGPIWSFTTIESTNSHPFLSNEGPVNASVNVKREVYSINTTVNDPDNDSMNIIIQWNNHNQDWVVLETYDEVSGGVYNASNLTDEEWVWGNTTYYWSVSVSDGIQWTNETYFYTTDGSRYDVNNDNYVNFQDAGLVWIHRTDELDYSSIYDVNGDNQINFQDAGLTWINRD